MDTSKVLYAPQILATIASLRVVDSGNACHRQRESMPLGAKFATDHRKSSCLAESVDGKGVSNWRCTLFPTLTNLCGKTRLDYHTH